MDSPVASRAPCPVGASEKIWIEFFEFSDGAHQRLEGLVGFGWEDLEGESKVSGLKEFVQPHDMTSDKIQFSNACCECLRFTPAFQFAGAYSLGAYVAVVRERKALRGKVAALKTAHKHTLRLLFLECCFTI